MVVQTPRHYGRFDQHHQYHPEVFEGRYLETTHLGTTHRESRVPISKLPTLQVAEMSQTFMFAYYLFHHTPTQHVTILFILVPNFHNHLPAPRPARLHRLKWALCSESSSEYLGGLKIKQSIKGTDGVDKLF